VIEPSPDSWPNRAVKVALLSGVLFRHDAISHSLRLKLDLLRRLRAAGRPLDVTAFVQATDEPAADVVVCHDVADLGYQPAFLDADLYVFEFGIHYRLFDAIFLVRNAERILAVYHNITPLALVTDEAARASVERACLQQNNLWNVGHIACDSDFNRRELIELGFDEDRLSVLHLPPGRDAAPRAAPADDAPVELLFVGRIVRAKGVLDLLEACQRLEAAGGSPFRVTIVGSPTFSEASVLSSLRATQESSVRYVGALSEDEVADAMAQADVLVMPSYHEGYCLPIVEAFQAGCRVIAYDSGNLPTIVDGHGQVVPTGDVDALTEAMAIAIAEVAAARSGAMDFVTTTSRRLERSVWASRVAEHVERHSRARYEGQLRSLLAEREQAVLSTGRAGSRA
jgi:glycosyltransferase involved in cell wall biosynthesis